MEAAYYEIDSSGQARCHLCPHHCRIALGHRGRCRTRYYDGEQLQWLASLSPDIPLHLTRYFPQYRWSTPATPLATMKQLQAAASPYLHYVYLGNV